MNVIASTDLWFPGRYDPIGDPAGNIGHGAILRGADSTRYVVWVDAGRRHAPGSRPELQVRMGLHLVECRNGAQP